MSAAASQASAHPRPEKALKQSKIAVNFGENAIRVPSGEFLNFNSRFGGGGCRPSLGLRCRCMGRLKMPFKTGNLKALGLECWTAAVQFRRPDLNQLGSRIF